MAIKEWEIQIYIVDSSFRVFPLKVNKKIWRKKPSVYVQVRSGPHKGESITITRRDWGKNATLTFAGFESEREAEDWRTVKKALVEAVGAVAGKMHELNVVECNHCRYRNRKGYFRISNRVRRCPLCGCEDLTIY